LHRHEDTSESMPQRLSVAVGVCTYQRVDELARCLSGIQAQTRRPDELIVTVRDEDEATRRFLAEYAGQAEGRGALRPTICVVEKPGLIMARIAAVKACRSDVLAMLDDDAVPHATWLERIEQRFLGDPRLGGLGGRDRCWNGKGFDERRAETVGRLQYWGRRIGNHHLGYGTLREVDVLKGANMSFRTKVFETANFDQRLRGTGSVPYEDIAVSLAVRRGGWRIAYDPEVVVDHYEGARTEPRYYSQTMAVKEASGFRNFAFNGVVALWDEMSWLRRAVFLAWSALVGTRVCPGLVQAIRLTPKLGRASWSRFVIAQQGIAQACWFLARGGNHPGHPA
jgi:GT2 family glycosyltransferase